MKTKNPLYVVKGKTVLEAKGVVDLILKKFNLEPAVEILMKLVDFLMSQVKDYPTFLAIKKVVDELTERITKITGMFHKA